MVAFCCAQNVNVDDTKRRRSNEDVLTVHGCWGWWVGGARRVGGGDGAGGLVGWWAGGAVRAGGTGLLSSGNATLSRLVFLVPCDKYIKKTTLLESIHLRLSF